MQPVLNVVSVVQDDLAEVEQFLLCHVVSKAWLTHPRRYWGQIRLLWVAVRFSAHRVYCVYLQDLLKIISHRLVVENNMICFRVFVLQFLFYSIDSILESLSFFNKLFFGCRPVWYWANHGSMSALCQEAVEECPLNIRLVGVGIRLLSNIVSFFLDRSMCSIWELEVRIVNFRRLLS